MHLSLRRRIPYVIAARSSVSGSANIEFLLDGPLLVEHSGNKQRLFAGPEVKVTATAQSGMAGVTADSAAELVRRECLERLQDRIRTRRPLLEGNSLFGEGGTESGGEGFWPELVELDLCEPSPGRRRPSGEHSTFVRDRQIVRWMHALEPNADVTEAFAAQEGSRQHLVFSHERCSTWENAREAAAYLGLDLPRFEGQRAVTLSLRMPEASLREWRHTPRQLTAAHGIAFRRVSLAVQSALRVWLAYEMAAVGETPAPHLTAYLDSRVFRGRRAGDFAYDVQSHPAVGAFERSLPRGEVRHFRNLLMTDAAVIDSLVTLASQARSGEDLSAAGARWVAGMNVRLRRFYRQYDLTAFTPLILILATAALVDSAPPSYGYVRQEGNEHILRSEWPGAAASAELRAA